jgi:hypothetical protein
MTNTRWNRFWLLLVICLVALTGCGKKVKSQSLRLDDNTRVLLKDAYLVDHAPPFLQAVLVYEGPDPNVTYDLSASLRETKDGPDHPRGWIKQYPTPSPKASNRYDVIWEFTGFPNTSQQIYLRLDCTDKQTGRSARKLEFVLPGVADLPLHKLGE